MITKDIAYDLMTNDSLEKASNTVTKIEDREDSDNNFDTLLDKINASASSGKYNTEAKITMATPVPEGLLLNIIDTKTNSVIEDVLLPEEKIVSQEAERAREQLRKIQERMRRIIEITVIYPAAVVSLIITIHGFMQILPKLEGIF